MRCSEHMGDGRRLISRSGCNGHLWSWEHSGDSGTFLEGSQMGAERALRDPGGSGGHLWEFRGRIPGSKVRGA